MSGNFALLREQWVNIADTDTASSDVGEYAIPVYIVLIILVFSCSHTTPLYPPQYLEHQYEHVKGLLAQYYDDINMADRKQGFLHRVTCVSAFAYSFSHIFYLSFFRNSYGSGIVRMYL